MRWNVAAALGTDHQEVNRHATNIPQAITVAAQARLVNCPQCWQRPGKPCTFAGPAGNHLARCQRAERRGLIGREDLAAVVARLEVSPGT